MNDNAVCMCFCRHGTHAAAAAAATAGLPHGFGHAAKHAGHDGNELWRADASRRHPYAGQLSYDVVLDFVCMFFLFFFFFWVQLIVPRGFFAILAFSANLLICLQLMNT